MRCSFTSLIISLSVLALAGCNLPQTSTPDTNSVATIVAAALTATQNALPPTQLPPTQPPTATSQPSPSLSPQPSSTSTLEPTNTSTPIPTTTLTSTATLNLSDPKASLGKPTWEDLFSDGKKWGLQGEVYDDGNTRIEIKNEALLFTSLRGQYWHGWRVTYPKPQNFYLEASVHNINCSDGDYYGLLFRSTEQFEGYWYGVSCQGKFNLRTGGIGGWKEPVTAQSSSAILTGPDKTNRLGVMVKDARISLYVNGKLVKELTDTAFPDAGTFGLFIAGLNKNFAFETLEMAYWELP